MTICRKTMLLVGVLFSFAVVAVPLTREEKEHDFNQIVSIIHTNYGPLKYKSESQGISIPALESEFRNTALNSSTNRDFYYALVKFVAAFNDSHFSLSVPTDHMSYLGFMTDLVGDKVLIDTVDRTVLSKSVFPFERGDEVVSLDGVDVASVVKELAPYINAGYSRSKVRRATMAVAQRAGSRMPVPTGPVMVKVRFRKDAKVKTVALNWIERGTVLDEANFRPSLHELREGAPSFSISIKEGDDELLPFRTEDSFRCSGKTRIKIPEGATMVMEAPFVAYYHATEKGNVGYLRIPHYQSMSLDPQPLPMYANYIAAMTKLKAETVGLVIDQDHNCGGQVDLVENMVKFFMDRPYERLQFKMRASKSEYIRYKPWPYVANVIYEAWTNGIFLSAKTPLTGSNLAQPYPEQMRYTKPVVMLIDEMSGSGGDAFPSMMQGFGRSKLIGTRTMGAGGHVEELDLANTFSATKMRLTRSLFFRPDGTPVENNGATPDFRYDITEKDFVDGYTDYQKFYLDKLMSQL